MLKMAMSQAACGLLRALLKRSGDEANRILLSEVQSVDWQSLTFAGERHLLQLRVAGPGADAIARRFTFGIEDAEFSIPGQIVADIAVAGATIRALDGSITLAIEALTVTE
ncbi:MAG TPA: hypothetical protein VMN38_07450 [Sphingomicrobium sp.]|nr:hypothetical protein [Sphingomicrobium sp.]